jgi:hypothetical protein
LLLVVVAVRPVLPALVAVLVTAGPARVFAQAVPADFAITLERTQCFGTCPAYSVRIDAAGNVTYEGTHFVRVEGLQTDRVPVSAAAALLATVQRIGFFDLADQYREITNPDGTVTTMTDQRTTFVTVTSGGRSKRIEDYFGTPRELRDLERQIDDVARTVRWIRIDGPELARLVRENGPPSADDLADWLYNALVYDEVDAIQALLAAGADPNSAYLDSAVRPLMMAESPGAVRALLEAGADPLIVSEIGSTALGKAAYLAPDATRFLLEEGIPVDEPAAADGRTALWQAACGGNLGVVQLLLAAGADPRLRPSNVSAIECARRNRQRERDRRPLPRYSEPPWVPDFDGVIALLEQALAAR